MDPVSLAATIIGFIDAADKLKTSLEKVGANKRKFIRLRTDVVRGLSDLEKLFRVNAQTLSAPNAGELRTTLEDLRRDLEEVRNLSDAHIVVGTSAGQLSVVKSNFKSWLRRGEIEEEIAGLEQRIQACYIRFQVYITSSTQLTALRMEERQIHNHQQRRDDVLRFENVFVQMMGRPFSVYHPALSFLRHSGLDALDIHFLLRQIRKFFSTVNELLSEHMSFDEAAAGPHLDSLARQFPVWHQSPPDRFSHLLSNVCQILQGPSAKGPVQDCAYTMFNMPAPLDSLGLAEEAHTALSLSVDLYSKLFQNTRSINFERHLGTALSVTGYFEPHTLAGLSASKRAVEIFDNLYNTHDDADDLDNLLLALNAHAQSLRVRGEIEESLDCTQQSLILHREWARLYDKTYYSSHQPVTWAASGEASVVFSAVNSCTHTVYVAFEEARALWNLACSLAALGRYAEARVAGVDGISAMNAVLCGAPKAYCYSARYPVRWAKEVSSWVSLPCCPTEEGNTIEEVDDSSSL
ncbi:hypothetical protein HGRIS_007279 [Hohenbuehelia grisea]|uniref:Fungal N-terminal domain-containing protein n=1 Tax=Hohenbuehelia grisea TaxID=104357 RepID=A0ABR3JBR3_9AGAR